jgi:hypothetical protein
MSRKKSTPASPKVIYENDGSPLKKGEIDGSLE